MDFERHFVIRGLSFTKKNIISWCSLCPITLQCNYIRLFRLRRFCVGDKFYLADNKILCGYDYEERMVFAKMTYDYNNIAHIKRQTENLTPGVVPNSVPPPLPQQQQPQHYHQGTGSGLTGGGSGGVVANSMTVGTNPSSGHPPQQQQQQSEESSEYGSPDSGYGAKWLNKMGQQVSQYENKLWCCPIEKELWRNRYFTN